MFDLTQKQLNKRNESISQGTMNILRPDELTQFLEAIPNKQKRFSVKTAFMTGLRLQELVDFSKHPEWLNIKYYAIIIPAKFSKTKENRYSYLTKTFAESLDTYLTFGKLWYPIKKNSKNKTIPDYNSWNQWYKRIALKAKLDNPHEVKAKISRKSWESWLIKSDYLHVKVFISQGHSDLTAFKHYLNMAFTPEQKALATELTREWQG